MEYTNRSLLVLVDSRQGESYADVAPGILAGLDHWGMPYRCHDLAAGQPGSESILHCAAVIPAQENVCAVLTDETARCIEQAVSGGVGYVGCDSRVGFAPPALQHALGVRAHDILAVYGTQTVDVAHWVGEWQDPEHWKRWESVVQNCLQPPEKELHDIWTRSRKGDESGERLNELMTAAARDALLRLYPGVERFID